MCGGAKPARSLRCAGRIMSATFEPRLPFEDGEVRLKADATVVAAATVTADAAVTGGVRLQPDHSGSASTPPVTGDVRLQPDHSGSASTPPVTGDVRLQPDHSGSASTPPVTGDVRLQPDHSGSASTPPVTGGVRLQPDHSGGPSTEPDLADADARRAAVDPSQNIVLEASAGTGKTRVLVERYVNLLRAGIEPDHILAITFTRKAAAEMRQRIIDRLKEASRLSELDAGRWRDIRERLGDIAVSTIDAFCLSLLREFPLEADVDPGFDLADNTEVPRLIGESLDQAFRICRGIAGDDDDVALVFAQLGERRLRSGIAALLDRRLVAPHALRRFLQKGPRDLTAATACALATARLSDVLGAVRDGLDAFLADGPCR